MSADPAASIPESPELDAARIASLYRLMLLVRRFEERMMELYKAGTIPGWLHTHIGQEGTSVGIVSQLRRTDYLFCGHRGHANLLAKGVDPGRLAAEILGREDGLCGGRGGEVHLADVEHGCLHTTGIVGQQTPLALGAAFRCAYRPEDDRISVCIFGDGAVGQGVVHESLNLAVVLKLPVLFICENNGYAVGTRSEDASPGRDLAQWAGSYGLPTYVVDGNDVLATYRTAQEAIAQIRGSGEPAFMECKVTRQLGHHMGDAQTYRAQEEVDAAKESDVLTKFADDVVRAGVSKGELERLADDVQREVDVALEFALASPVPAPETLTSMVWAGGS